MVTLSGHLSSHSIPFYHKMNIKGFPMQMRAHHLQKYAKEKNRLHAKITRNLSGTLTSCQLQEDIQTHTSQGHTHEDVGNHPDINQEQQPHNTSKPQRHLGSDVMI